MKTKHLLIAVATALCAVFISAAFHHFHWQDLLLLSPLLGAIQYSGGTRINRTFTPATRADWVNNITQALSDAGWTTISGTPGSGSDVKLESAANNNGAKIRFRFLEPGSGNCAQITMKNVAESVTSQIYYCLPTAGSGQWKVIANKFHFFAFATGGANATAARGWLFGGTLYTPTFWVPPSDSIGFVYGGGNADADTGLRLGWRRSLRKGVGTSVCAPFSGINSGTIVQGNNTSDVGWISIPVWQGGYNNEDQSYRWEDNTLTVYEPLLSWATGSASTNEGKIKGQLYDAVVLNGSWTGEAGFSLDGHTWLVVTDAPAGAIAATAVLLLAVT